MFSVVLWRSFNIERDLQLALESHFRPMLLKLLFSRFSYRRDIHFALDSHLHAPSSIRQEFSRITSKSHFAFANSSIAWLPS
jgi:hypothetical protein